MKATIFLITVLIASLSQCSEKDKKNDVTYSVSRDGRLVEIPASQQTPKTKRTKKPEKIPFDYCSNSVSIKQGLYGCCTYKTGNCMPIVDTNQCKWYAVKRTIYFYEPTTEKQTVNAYSTHSTWYTKINTRLIAKTQSDDNGCYQISLPAGKYSILILENGRYYCGSWADNFLLCPVTIDSNKVKKQNLCINLAVW